MPNNPNPQLKEMTGSDKLISFFERRRIRSLVLNIDKRKTERRIQTNSVTHERRRKVTNLKDLRRKEIRKDFFCNVFVKPGDSRRKPEQKIEGKILNTSQNGMAILIPKWAAWVNPGSSIQIKTNNLKKQSAVVIWNKYSPNYFNSGNKYILGISLEVQKKIGKEKKKPQSPLKWNLGKINSIADLSQSKFYPLFIGGKDIDTGIYGFAQDAKTFLTFPTRSKEIITSLSQRRIPKQFSDYIFGIFCIATDRDIQHSIDEAFKAFRVFRNISMSRKRRLFYDIYENIKKFRKQLIDLMVKEGHPLKLANWEYAGMVKAFEPATIHFFSKQIFKNIGKDGVENLYLSRKPDGVVCVIPPGNAPCPNSLLTAFSLLAGNTLIIKPPLRTPISTFFLWKNIIGSALKKNNIPPGVINIINGDSERVLDIWLNHPKVSDIVFFGETSVGLKIGSQIYQNGKKPILELSGNDTMVIWKDGNLEKAAQSLVEGCMGSMQICMVARRAIVHPMVYEKFEKLVLNKIKEIRAGLPDDPGVDLAPVSKCQEFYEFLYDALKKGAKLIYGGTRIDHTNTPNPNGFFITPTILRVDNIQKALTLKCTREEGFFPLLTLIKASGNSPFKNDNEVYSKMTRFLEQNKFGLRISIWSNSQRFIKRFIKEVNNSGILRINLPHIGFSAFVGTHGGPGCSGGPFGEMNYLWEKTSHLQGVCVNIHNQVNDHIR